MVEVKFGSLKDANKSMPEGIIPPLARISPTTIAYFTALQPYARLVVDLSVARASLTAIGGMVLPDGTAVPAWAANTLVVSALTTGGLFTFAVGDAFTVPGASGEITGSSAMRLEGIPFTQLYIKNTAQPTTTAEFVLAWVD